MAEVSRQWVTGSEQTLMLLFGRTVVQVCKFIKLLEPSRLWCLSSADFSLEIAAETADIVCSCLASLLVELLKRACFVLAVALFAPCELQP